MGSVRVLLADDHEIVRKGLRALIEGQSGWEVVAEVSNGRDAVAKAKQLRPHIAVLDIGMPLLNGLEAARRISKSGFSTRILILTMHESKELIQQVLEAGAWGYVLKSDAGRDLVSAIEALSQKNTFFTSKVGQTILEGYLGKGLGPKNIKGDVKSDTLLLTSRQREVLQLIAEGKSCKEVASELGLSTKTAATHRANLMRELGCHTVAELVRYAVRNQIIEI